MKNKIIVIIIILNVNIILFAEDEINNIYEKYNRWGYELTSFEEYSQYYNILLDLYKKYPNDGNILERLARASVLNNKFDDAILYFSKMNSIEGELGKFKVFCRINKIDDAKKIYDILIKNTEKLRYYNNFERLQWMFFIGNYDDAIRYIESKQIENCEHYIGYAYFFKKDYKQALDYLIKYKTNEKYIVGFHYAIIYYSYCFLNQKEEGIKYLKELQYNIFNVYNSYFSKNDLDFLLGNININDFINDAENMPNFTEKAIKYYFIGNYYKMSNKIDTAKKYFNISIGIKEFTSFDSWFFPFFNYELTDSKKKRRLTRNMTSLGVHRFALRGHFASASTKRLIFPGDISTTLY